MFKSILHALVTIVTLAQTADSVPAERVYTPLSAMLAFGKDEVLDGFRRVAGTGAAGAAFVDFGLDPAEKNAAEEESHAR